jgi:hypothetical protein
MTWNRRAAFAVSFALLPACFIEIADDDPATCTGGTCDGVDQSCADPRYDDGICQTSLDCAVPDIDCFRTFQDDAAGAAWFAEIEPRAAAREGRAPRAILSPADPRFAKVRTLLDRGWAAMRTSRPVGRLADARPALVFVEDPSVNAFVYPEDLDQKRASFAVMIHTGTLGIDTTEDANLGLMMHELQHAVGLHVIAEVQQRFSQYYVASPDREPIGQRQHDNADAREAATLWLARAGEIGSLTNAELRGLPVGGDLGRVFRTVFATGLQQNPTGCAHSRDLFAQIVADLDAATDLVSGAPHLDAGMGPRITAALAAMRTECLPGFSKTFVQVVAELAGATPAQIDAQLTPEDRALIAGKHVVDAIAALGNDRRATMRTIEAAFQTQLGQPWSMLRYYSTEEAADDVTVPVLRKAGLDPAGLGTFFLDVLLPRTMSDACQAALATGAVPAYGVDLTDMHHATCWRVYHLDALAADTTKPGAHRAQAQPITAQPPRLPMLPAREHFATY